MIAERSTLVNRYAQAFLNAFDETITQKSYIAIQDAARFFSGKRSRFLLMTLTYVDDSTSKKIFSKVCECFGLGSSIKKLLLLIAKQRRQFLFPDILDRICLLYRRRNGIMSCRLTTSHPISEDDRKIIRKYLAEKTGYKVWCNKCYCVDSSLISGIRLQSDSLFWEYSLRDRIDSVRRRLVGDAV